MVEGAVTAVPLVRPPPPLTHFIHSMVGEGETRHQCSLDDCTLATPQKTILVLAFRVSLKLLKKER